MQNTRRIKFYLLVKLLIISNCLIANDNDSTDDSSQSLGIITGYGVQSMLDVQYEYEVLFFQIQYYWTFLPRDIWSLKVLIQPQYNLTKFRYVNHVSPFENGYEFGLNVGLLIRKNLYRDLLMIYAAASVGPHYVSGAPQRQTAGFIFSDNIFIGLNIKVSRNTYLDIRPGFRHISNAGLKRPNRGINNLIFSGGILYNL